MNRSSLYAAFGAKRDLYLHAQARYAEGSAARIAAALQGRRIDQGLKHFFDALIDSIVAGPGRRGCFIGNCAAEMARLDRRAAACVRKSLARIESTFRAALEEARARGELPDDADTGALALSHLRCAGLAAGRQGQPGPPCARRYCSSDAALPETLMPRRLPCP